MKVEKTAAVIHYVTGQTDELSREVAERLKSSFIEGRINPQGIINFDNTTIIVTNIVKINWLF